MIRWLFIEVHGSPVHEWLLIGTLVGLAVGGVIAALFFGMDVGRCRSNGDCAPEF